ncbi:putative quinol monooxygenase [Rouxiella sp. WC2420]|uniref:Quinol monooxygenase n=1 Tax=Rouxiella sp. WC2420 TaxID=3234145 RepID=A0AB39VV39_9GAMM
MSSEVKLVVLITTQPGRGQDQIAAFEKLAPLVRKEEGCIEYELYPVAEQADQFVLLERWASKSALEAHAASAHMAAASKLNPAFRAGPATVLHLGSSVAV